MVETISLGSAHAARNFDSRQALEKWAKRCDGQPSKPQQVPEIGQQGIFLLPRRVMKIKAGEFSVGVVLESFIRLAEGLLN